MTIFFVLLSTRGLALFYPTRQSCSLFFNSVHSSSYLIASIKINVLPGSFCSATIIRRNDAKWETLREENVSFD